MLMKLLDVKKEKQVNKYGMKEIISYICKKYFHIYKLLKQSKKKINNKVNIKFLLYIIIKPIKI